MSKNTWRESGTPFLHNLRQHLSPTELAERRGLHAVTLLKLYMFTSDRLKFSLGRKFMMKSNGSVGLVPPKAKPGETVAILIGAPIPQIFRKNGDKCYQIVGEC